MGAAGLVAENERNRGVKVYKQHHIRSFDAPDGYMAIAMPKEAEADCAGCAFSRSRRCGGDRPCASGERKDGRNVIFIRKPKGRKGVGV